MDHYKLLINELNTRKEKCRLKSYKIDINIFCEVIYWLDGIVRQDETVLIDIRYLACMLNISVPDAEKVLMQLEGKKVISKSKNKNVNEYKYRNFAHLLNPLDL